MLPRGKTLLWFLATAVLTFTIAVWWGRWQTLRDGATRLPRPVAWYFDDRAECVWCETRWGPLKAIHAEDRKQPLGCGAFFLDPRSLKRRATPESVRLRIYATAASNPGIAIWSATVVAGEWPLDFLWTSDVYATARATGEPVIAILEEPDCRAAQVLSTYLFRGEGTELEWSLSPSILTRNILILLAASALLTTCSRSTYTFLLHRHRRARNRCLPCGYPRPDAGSPCPECGAHPAPPNTPHSPQYHPA